MPLGAIKIAMMAITAVCSPECENGGTCISPNECKCLDGYQGAQCETPVCSLECRNGGICISPSVCSCPDGYEGDQCETPVCFPECENGGTCISPSNCSCQDGYQGAQCETPVCSPECRNGGTCISPSNCSCQDGYQGAQCETPVCSPECDNGGTCISPSNCSCPYGYQGDQCETRPCNLYLGVEDGRISDNQLTASSELDHNHGATYARLNRPAQSGATGAWSPKVNNVSQWIQTDLGDPKWVTGVLLQGRLDHPEWVTKFKVQYSDDGDNWQYVRQTGNVNEMEFNGNADQNTVIASHFLWPIKASFIRIRPTAWKQWISLRFELVGCKVRNCSDEADWMTFGDHQYCFVHAPEVPYTQAEAECEKLGANLTSIHSQEEQDFIASNTMDFSLQSDNWWGYWIGLNDRDDEGTFVWTDGTETNYTNWGPGQPDDASSQQCVVLSPYINYEWDDQYCNTLKRAYVCKKQP